MGAHLQLQGVVPHAPPPRRHLRARPRRVHGPPGARQPEAGRGRLLLRPRHRPVRRPRGAHLPCRRRQRRGRRGRRRAHPAHPRVPRRGAVPGPAPGDHLLPRRQLRALGVQHHHLRQPLPPVREAEQGRGGVRQLPARPGAPVPVRVRRRVGRAQVGPSPAVPAERRGRAAPRVPRRRQLRRQHRAPRGRSRRGGGDQDTRQHPAQRHVRRQRAHRVGAAPGRQVLRHAPGQGLVLEGVPAGGRGPGPPGVQPVRAERAAAQGPALRQEPHHRVGAGPHLRPAAGLRRGPPGGRPRREAGAPREGHHRLLPAVQHGPLPRGDGGDRRVRPS
uniref:Uncharacterized protein n=1 Tax=Aegilops tauschii subsp. strangulata TaxID=200361 RepID=A0A452Z3A5_AEGTS